MSIENPAGRQGVDANVPAGVIGCQVAGETKHASFGYGVISRFEGSCAVRAFVEALIRTRQTIGGTNVDDHALACFEHWLHGSLGGKEHAGEVDIQRLSPGIERVAFKGIRALGAGVGGVKFWVQRGAVD